MTTYTWPTGRAWVPHRQTLRVVDNTQRVSESTLSGAVQTVSMPGARWAWDLEIATQSAAERQALEAFLIRLSGRQHRVSLWDLKRPAPAGTINRTGVTLAASAAQFATSLQLTGCGASATLLAGDWIGLSTGQLVMAVADATANGSGVMTVEVRHMLRTGLPSGAAVTLLQPTAEYMLADGSPASMRSAGRRFGEAVSISFVEAFA